MNGRIWIVFIVLVSSVLIGTMDGRVRIFKKFDARVNALTINSGKHFLADDWVIIRCEWQRIGKARIKVSIIVDGSERKSQIISRGKSTKGTLIYRWKALPGKHVFTGKVKPVKRTREKSKRNNKKTISKFVAHRWPSSARPNEKLPDLYVAGLDWKVLDNRNKHVKFLVKIGNKGTAKFDGKNCSVEIHIQNTRNPNNKSTAWASVKQPLNPGQTTVVEQVFNSMHGNWNIHLHVDQRNRVRETIENNNKYVKRNYYVYKVSQWPEAEK